MHEKSAQRSDLRRSLSLVTMAGCLAMVYVTGIASPAFTDFVRALGATELYFGLLSGIPLILLSLQLVGAIVTNLVVRRKRLIMALLICGRLMFLPAALVHVLFPGLASSAKLNVVLIVVMSMSALMNIAVPLWFSVMADLIPRRVLNAYWGNRLRWMFLVWTLAYLAVAVFARNTRLPITIVFPITAALGVAAGVADVILFGWVHEPPNVLATGLPILGTVLAPFKDNRFRPFVLASCAWSAAVMFSAAFMQIFALEVLRLGVAEVTVIWCSLGVGIALSSSQWGKIAARHGHRPILAICMALKCLVVLAFLFASPASAFWLLLAAVFADSIWEAGLTVATTAHMLTAAPRRNRSMFIAAVAGVAGICGGLGAVLGGAFLRHLSDFSWHCAGRTWNNYHLLFLANFFMRLACVPLVLKMREPESSSTELVLQELRGIWPMRVLLFPVGLYRRPAAAGGRQEEVGPQNIE